MNKSEIANQEIRPGNLLRITDESSNIVKYSPFIGYCLGIIKNRICRVYDKKNQIIKNFPLHSNRFLFIIIQNKFTKRAKPNFIKYTSQAKLLKRLKSNITNN